MTAAIALHKALYTEGSLVLIVAPAERQALEFFAKVSAGYRRLSGEAFTVPSASDRKLGIALRNGSRIESLPGSERTIRGFSAPDLIVVDEASRIDDALFVALMPMLTVSRNGGRLLMLSTPYGKRGIFWRLWSGEDSEASAGLWHKVLVPVTEVPRVPKEAVEQARHTLSPLDFAQEYECAFIASNAAVFDPDDIERAFQTKHQGRQLGGAAAWLAKRLA